MDHDEANRLADVLRDSPLQCRVTVDPRDDDAIVSGPGENARFSDAVVTVLVEGPKSTMPLLLPQAKERAVDVARRSGFSIGDDDIRTRQIAVEKPRDIGR